MKRVGRGLCGSKRIPLNRNTGTHTQVLLPINTQYSLSVLSERTAGAALALIIQCISVVFSFQPWRKSSLQEQMKETSRLWFISLGKWDVWALWQYWLETVHSLSLARSLFPSLLYIFVFLSRINMHRMGTLGVCLLHVLWWPNVHIHAYAARHVQSSSGMTGTEVFAREQLLPC